MTEYNLYDSNNVCNEINFDKLSLKQFSERKNYYRYFIAEEDKTIVIKSKKFFRKYNFKEFTELSNDLYINNYDFKISLSNLDLDNSHFKYTQNMLGDRIKETLCKSNNIFIENNIISFDKYFCPFFGGVFGPRDYTTIEYVKTDGSVIRISTHHKMLENLFDNIKLEFEFFYTPVIYSNYGFNFLKNEILYLRLYQTPIQYDELSDLTF